MKFCEGQRVITDSKCLVLSYLLNRCGQAVPKKKVVEDLKQKKSETTLYRILKELEREGKIQTEKVMVNGRKVHVIILNEEVCKKLKEEFRVCEYLESIVRGW